MKNVIFVSYSFPPLLEPRSIQTLRTANYLLLYGWRPTVLTVDANYSSVKIDNSLLDLLSNSIEIVRAKSMESKLVLKILGRTFKSLLRLPDSKVAWYLYAKEKSSYLFKKNHFDIILSCAFYLSSHLVGLSLKEKTKLPWVAHFSDPWVDNPYLKYGRIDGYINRKMEKTVIKKADAIVFVTEETRQLVMKKYPSKMMDKAFVIPHCYDTELLARFEKERNSKFTLTYTGSFYYGIRAPVTLFKAVSTIVKNRPDISESLNIQIVGGLHEDYKNMILELGIDEVVSVVGTVSYLKSLEYILNADVLLLIDAPSEGPSVFLPSKLVEYIGSGNPILGITPLKGASANLIRQVNGIVVEPNDVEGIEKAILTLYEKYQAGNLSDYLYTREDTAMYDARNTTKKLVELFDAVLR